MKGQQKRPIIIDTSSMSLTATAIQSRPEYKTILDIIFYITAAVSMLGVKLIVNNITFSPSGLEL